MQGMTRFVQVLQLEQGSRVDRFRAYHSLIYSHRNLLHLVAKAKSTGQVLSETSLQ